MNETKGCLERSKSIHNALELVEKWNVKYTLWFVKQCKTTNIQINLNNSSHLGKNKSFIIPQE